MCALPRWRSSAKEVLASKEDINFNDASNLHQRKPCRWEMNNVKLGRITAEEVTGRETVSLSRYGVGFVITICL